MFYDGTNMIIGVIIFPPSIQMDTLMKIMDGIGELSKISDDCDSSLHFNRWKKNKQRLYPFHHWNNLFECFLCLWVVNSIPFRDSFLRLHRSSIKMTGYVFEEKFCKQCLHDVWCKRLVFERSSSRQEARWQKVAWFVWKLFWRDRSVYIRVAFEHSQNFLFYILSIRKIRKGFPQIPIVNTKNPMNSSEEIRRENGQKYLWGIVQAIRTENSSSIGPNKIGIARVPMSLCLWKSSLEKIEKQVCDMYFFTEKSSKLSFSLITVQLFTLNQMSIFLNFCKTEILTISRKTEFSLNWQKFNGRSDWFHRSGDRNVNTQFTFRAHKQKIAWRKNYTVKEGSTLNAQLKHPRKRVYRRVFRFLDVQTYCCGMLYWKSV